MVCGLGPQRCVPRALPTCALPPPSEELPWHPGEATAPQWVPDLSRAGLEALVLRVIKRAQGASQLSVIAVLEGEQACTRVCSGGPANLAPTPPRGHSSSSWLITGLEGLGGSPPPDQLQGLGQLPCWPGSPVLTSAGCWCSGHAAWSRATDGKGSGIIRKPPWGHGSQGTDVQVTR